MSVDTEVEVYPVSKVLGLCPGLSYRMLDYWCRTDQLGPMDDDSISGENGSGNHRHFTANDVAAIRARLVLSTFGPNSRRTSTTRTVMARVRQWINDGSDDEMSIGSDGWHASRGESRLILARKEILRPIDSDHNP